MTLNHTNLFTWIKDKNEKQCSWAMKYIHDKGYHLATIMGENIVTAQYIHDALSRVSEDKRTLISRDMKNAWRQKQTRDNRKTTKSYSFVIDTVTNRHLTTLAKTHKQPRNKTIELLINNGFDYEKNAKEDWAELERMACDLELENEKLKNALLIKTQEFKQLKIELQSKNNDCLEDETMNNSTISPEIEHNSTLPPKRIHTTNKNKNKRNRRKKK